mgnify:CR=1 FL=1
MESHAVAMQISDDVRASYQHYGYEVVVVPKAPVAERILFIQSFLEQG